MSPYDMLTAVEDALAAAPTRRGRRRVVLELRAPGGSVLGVHGKHLGVDDHGPIYGFTRAQCEEIRAVILAAARDDAEAAEQ